MKLIIDIPEEDYINIKNAINSLIENGCERTSVSQVCLAIVNGTPLPEHATNRDVINNINSIFGKNFSIPLVTTEEWLDVPYEEDEADANSD